MTTTSRLFLLAFSAVFAVCLTVGSSAKAENLTKEASRIDHEARVLFSQKRFRLAAQKFEEANGLAPHPATMFNAGVAWKQAGNLPRAADAFQICLQMEGLGVRRTEQAKKILEKLRQKLCWVRIERPIGAIVSVEHLNHAAVPVGVHLEPGPHRLEISLPDTPTRSVDFQCLAGKAMTLAITPLRLNATASNSNQPTRATHASSRPSDNEAPRAISSTTWGWLSLSLGAAAAATGTYFGVNTLHQRDIFESSGRTDVEAHDSAVRSRTLTNVFFGIAAAGTAAGIWLLWPRNEPGDNHKPKNSSASIRVAPGWIAAQVRF